MQPGGGQPPFPPAAQPAGTAAAAAQAPQQATAHTVEPAGAPYSRDGVPTSSTNAAGVPALQLAQLTQQQQQPYQGMPPPPPRRTSGVDQGESACIPVCHMCLCALKQGGVVQLRTRHLLPINQAPQ